MQQTPVPSIAPNPSPSSQSAHSRWHALTQRSRISHTSFLYGVKSTKIYCRPTCPARLARRANILFFDTADQARRAGFRACKRCRPDNGSFLGEREELVTRVLGLLRIGDGGFMVKKGAGELARQIGVSPSYLCRVFKGVMGVTLGEYVAEFERTTSETERECAGGLGPAPVESQTPGPADFDLDEWFWTEEYLDGSHCGLE